MQGEQMAIEIAGEEATDLYPAIESVSVELDEELAGTFRIELSMSQQPDGTWTQVDDERFAPWQEFVIHAGFDDGTEQLLDGYLTHVTPLFDEDPTACKLELWGMDGTAPMDRQQQLKDWPSKKDSDIASEIFSTYGLSPDVTDTAVVHDEAVSTIIQRETDMAFLRRLARRNGFECYVEDGTGYFGPAGLDDESQPILAIHFGAESNLNWFKAEVDALSESNVGMFQLDRVEKEVLSSAAEASLQTAFGGSTAVDLLPAGFDPGQAFVSMTATTGLEEMEALCQGLFHRVEWLVTGEGVVAGNRYGSVLRPRKPVTIKGVGETHSGVYYVTHVTHTITANGYSQYFKVKRNGLLPTGGEDFGGDGLLGGL